MAKKLLCVLLSVLMVVSLLPTGLFADEDVDYSLWYWTDGGVFVKYYYGDATDITLPTYKSDGTTLSVGIYSSTFGDATLSGTSKNPTVEIIRFPDTYTDIPARSFANCTALREVYLPSGLSMFNNQTFCYDTALEYVLVPSGVSGKIGSKVLMGCTNPDLILDIQSTTISSIDSNAFQDVCGTIVVYSTEMYEMATAAVSTSTNCTATVVYGPVTEIDVTVDVSEVAEEDVPESVSVSLYDGEEAVMTKSVTSSGNWERTLRLTGTTGSESYSVTAANIEGYTAEVTGDTENGFVVTYTAEAEEEESTELRGIYGGYGAGNVYNQETQSYSILCTDDLSTSQREATIGTTSVKFYFDANTDFASNLQYQVAYGTVYLWNFLDNQVSLSSPSMTGNSITYPLSITEVDTAYNITAGTGWTYDENNPVFLITSIEFLDSSGNVLLTLTDFSGANEEEEVDYTFPIEEKVLGSAGWSTSYDDTTGTITFSDAWTGCGWWFGSSSELILSEFTITTGNELDWQVVVEYVDGTTSTTVSATNGTATVTPEATAISQIYIQGKAAGDLTVTDVSYAVYQDTSLYYIFAFDVQDTSTWDGDWWLSSTQVEGNAEEGEVVTVTIDITDLLTATNLVADGSNLLITNSGETLSNVTMTVTYLDSQSVEQTLTYTVSSVPGSDNTIITTVTSELYNALNTSGTTVTLTFTVGAVSTRVSALTSGYQFIYVNEDYHALIVTREVAGVNRRFLISIPHEDENHDGYCDTCKEYVGTDEEEAEIVTIDDVEYEVVYSNEDGISAGNWTQVDLGDLDLIEALSQEGAILVITRDTETEVSFADGEYEKFLLIDSWWSNDQTPISLGTKGHTSSDEDVIDCTSDDGTTVIYDGATIYEAWEDGGYAEGGTSLVFISNTSASYKIVSIQVLVPVE